MSSLTYKTDNSFFTTVFPPFCYYGFAIKTWFMKNNNSKFRYIRDIEIEKEFWDVAQVQDIYPGIKTITIVLNPWARIRYAYIRLCEMKKNNDTSYLDLSTTDIGSFSDFVKRLPTMQTVNNFSFTLATPMSKWIYNEQTSVDFILKDEALEEDFKPLQQYFCIDVPLDLPIKLPSYKQFYNKTTKEIVAKLFKEDIEKFNYVF